MALRKVQHGEGWWAQRGDGSWVRWDAVRNDWQIQAEPPPGETGEAPPAESPEEPVLDFPVSSGTSGWALPMGAVLGFLASYLLLFLGAFVCILLAAAALAMLNLLLLFLGTPIDISGFIRETSIFAAVYLLAVQAAMMLVSRSPIHRWWGVLGWAGAFVVLLAGSAMAARVAGVHPPQELLAELNLWTLVGLGTMSLYVGAVRLLKRLRPFPRRAEGIARRMRALEPGW